MKDILIPNIGYTLAHCSVPKKPLVISSENKITPKDESYITYYFKHRQVALKFLTDKKRVIRNLDRAIIVVMSLSSVIWNGLIADDLMYFGSLDNGDRIVIRMDYGLLSQQIDLDVENPLLIKEGFDQYCLENP